MRSEGIPFIVGGLGVGPVFASGVSARRLSSSLLVVSSQFGAYGLLKVGKGVTFDCFQRRAASFRRFASQA